MTIKPSIGGMTPTFQCSSPVENFAFSGAVLILGFASLVAYWNSFAGAMVFDDKAAIIENASIRSLSDALFPPRDGGPAEARPLLNITFALNYALGEFSVRGYH